MPHFIVEYSANLEGELVLAPLFAEVHDYLIGLQLFPTGGIRSRGRRIEHYRFADGREAFAGVHAQLKLSAARPPQLRREIAAGVFEVLKQHLAPLQQRRYVALSLEVGLFDPETFFNHNNLHPLFPAPGTLARTTE
ncbi:5-carboxymethyl-2-hydroxymuconate isomerase [Pseudomonas sp. Marseille-P9899]|uniref:5-carboxymethyl-2-hydroxymuconate isomerase n=1 Tax=Pseudomonas sp. Marseille-P9899 TaxID=2730401 RepID=UPI0015884F79|nr:5-carboxymethyl-2-hydroxymuconate isomerase [Pseudomonas sp. Marseille-P9899]